MKTTSLFTILLIVISATSIAQSNINHELYPTKEITSKYHNDWTINHYKKRIKTFKDDPLKYGKIVFLGNSITEQGRNWNEKFNTNHIYNRGIGGDVTDGVIKRLDEITYYKPKAVFILIGINDLSSLHYEDTDQRFKYIKNVPSVKYIAKNILKIAKIIHKKSPKTEVYVRSILPTRRDYLNDDVARTNNLIKTYETKGYYKVIDLYTEFVDDKGALKKDLTYDGVHLNQKGYNKWVSFEKPILMRFIK
ncbi:GDSL-type esterase/lipase family protein [Aestuariibaculum sediminum]|uniref:GDSL family lipase n=1 Tax=Aestuariibaculum sediminum TaxID=2770637 RepID=A0A8J6U7N0_9FLAO|nr:GDSL-type esterase/lipase family protein [Aestuariibaculum sediminum]MBD0832183.1 GDSL family lipase [Aestuariibaculum sediminum]